MASSKYGIKRLIGDHEKQLLCVALLVANDYGLYHATLTFSAGRPTTARNGHSPVTGLWVSTIYDARPEEPPVITPMTRVQIGEQHCAVFLFCLIIIPIVTERNKSKQVVNKQNT